MKGQPTEWEKIFANNMMSQYPKYINNSKTSVLKETKNPVKTWAKNLNKIYTNWQQIHKRCSTSLIIQVET